MFKQNGKSINTVLQVTDETILWLEGTLWLSKCMAGITFIVYNEINPTELRQMEVHQRMFFLYIIILIIMSCIAVQVLEMPPWMQQTFFPV